MARLYIRIIWIAEVKIMGLSDIAEIIKKIKLGTGAPAPTPPFIPESVAWRDKLPSISATEKGAPALTADTMSPPQNLGFGRQSEALPSVGNPTPNGYPSALPPVDANVRDLQIPQFNQSLPPIGNVAPVMPSLGNPETGEQTDRWKQVLGNISLGQPAETAPVSAAPALPVLPSLRPSEQTANEAARIEGKKYGFQKDANGKVLLGENGKPLYGRDRDTDHNWWDVVKSIGLGFANGGVSGALGGALGGILDRNYDEKAVDGIKLNRLNQKFESQTKREEAQQAHDFKETQRKNIDADNARADDAIALRKATSERNSLLSQVRKMSRYKRGENPTFDAKLEAANVEQPDFEPGKKIKPRFWDTSNGKYMTFDKDGATVPVLRDDGTEIISLSKKEVGSGGYTVSPNVARSADAQVESSRVGAVNQTNNDKQNYDTKIVEAKSKIAGFGSRASRLKGEIAPLQAKLEGGTITKEEYDSLNKKQTELGTAQDGIAEQNDFIKNLPQPVPTVARTGVNVGTYSETQFRKQFEGVKTPPEIEKLVQAAKQQGIIK